MDFSESYIVNAPEAIEERFEAEVIVVNLDIGTYFSLRESAADAWVRMTAGQSPEQISVAWDGQFPGQATMREDLERFIGELVTERLIRVGIIQNAAVLTPVPLSLYTAPVLDKYTDMQDLLLLDPVHDVDETGWPTARPS